MLFRPRAGLSADDARAFGEAFERALKDIPFVRRANVGKRVMIGREYEQLMAVDYDYAAVIEFDDLAGLKGYLEHPTHDELGRRFFESIEAGLVYDFEMMTGADGVATLLERRGGA